MLESLTLRTTISENSRQLYKQIKQREQSKNTNLTRFDNSYVLGAEGERDVINQSITGYNQ